MVEFCVRFLLGVQRLPLFCAGSLESLLFILCMSSSSVISIQQSQMTLSTTFKDPHSQKNLSEDQERLIPAYGFLTTSLRMNKTSWTYYAALFSPLVTGNWSKKNPCTPNTPPCITFSWQLNSSHSNDAIPLPQIPLQTQDYAVVKIRM